jgi:predicted metalloenzyme YecM
VSVFVSKKESKMKELIGDYDPHVAKINDVLEMIGIRRSELSQLDHLCYRTETLEEYHRVLQDFAVLGRNLGEVDVQGRPISIIALNEPIETGGWIIDFLEIAAPKATSPYPSGLEHAEFVTRGLLEDFEQRHPDLPFIRDAMSRDINPELKYREHGISVKFHQLNIGAVIKIEEQLEKSSDG